MGHFIVRLPAMLLMWALQIAIKTPTMLLGLLVVPLTYKYRATKLQDCPWYLMPWINPEDWPGGFPGYEGTYPSFWHRRREAEGWSEFKAHYLYHAIRNPADGLRNFKWLNCKLESDKIKYFSSGYLEHYEPRFMEKGKWYWYLCYNGIYLGIKLNRVWSEDRYFELKLGFRIHPRDTKTVDLKSPRAILGASFASKFLPYREY